MNLQDRTLLRKLVWAVLIKLVVLTVLWWFFVRDVRVVVDEEAAAHRLLAPPVGITQE